MVATNTAIVYSIEKIHDTGKPKSISRQETNVKH